MSATLESVAEAIHALRKSHELDAAQSANNLCAQQQSQEGMVIGGAIGGLGQMLAEQRRSRITPAPHG